MRDTETGEEATRSPHKRWAGRQTGWRVVYGGETRALPYMAHFVTLLCSWVASPSLCSAMLLRTRPHSWHRFLWGWSCSITWHTRIAVQCDSFFREANNHACCSVQCSIMQSSAPQRCTIPWRAATLQCVVEITHTLLTSIAYNSFSILFYMLTNTVSV